MCCVRLRWMCDTYHIGDLAIMLGEGVSRDQSREMLKILAEQGVGACVLPALCWCWCCSPDSAPEPRPGWRTSFETALTPSHRASKALDRTRRVFCLPLQNWSTLLQCSTRAPAREHRRGRPQKTGPVRRETRQQEGELKIWRNKCCGKLSRAGHRSSVTRGRCGFTGENGVQSASCTKSSSSSLRARAHARVPRLPHTPPHPYAHSLARRVAGQQPPALFEHRRHRSR